DRDDAEAPIETGILPSLSASIIWTCLCSQTFINAESFLLPVYCSSFASCFLASKLLSMPVSFSKSTVGRRQSSFSGFVSFFWRFISVHQACSAGNPAQYNAES